MAQQTAVDKILESILDKMDDLDSDYQKGKQAWPLDYIHKVLNDILRKAYDCKQMEKEQIINAHTNGQAEYDTEAFRPKVKELAEQYYNEIYGNKS